MRLTQVGAAAMADTLTVMTGDGSPTNAHSLAG